MRGLAGGGEFERGLAVVGNLSEGTSSGGEFE